MLFGEVGRCAAGTLAGRPPLVVYDRPVPGTPTVVWLFPVVLTVLQALRAEGDARALFIQVHTDAGSDLNTAPET